ncbi:MAG: phosphonate ABC transporter, permease protein PhnE [Methylocystaceae bacterium]|nr:MAG: phosphonate ABC transporter, permease protein PhnE [Methylocystaceae bacterium]
MAFRLPRASRDEVAQFEAAYSSETRRRRARRALTAIAVLLVLILCAVAEDIEPNIFFARIGHLGDYVVRLFHLESGAAVFTDPAEWFWNWRAWSALLGETLLIAYAATVIGATIAFVASFLAAQNLTRSRLVPFLTRRFLEICRTVPDIVFALVFIFAFGLGALPGVLALALHTAGSLGKLFRELVENIDLKPVDALTATGANFWQVIRFAVWPQVASNYVGYGLLRFEMNVRGATVVGFVGAGGIGQDLVAAIRKFYYTDVSAILVMIIVTVFVIDLTTERLRHRLLDLGEAR